jgi:aminomethyltransferase
VITDDAGGVINDPVLLRLGYNHFWLALADSDVLLWAKGVALDAGLRVELAEPDVSPLQLQGPKAKEVAAALFGERASALRYYHFFETSLDGIPLVVTRTGWSGEFGYEIYLRDGSRGDELWERIMAAGRAHRIRPTGPSDIRRIEAGILNYGADFTLENNVYEVGLERLVDEDKRSPYFGRDALARIRAAGVERKLVGIEIAGPRIEFNATRWPVRVGARTVGHVTSAIWSPRLAKNIGYAMLPVAHAALGRVLRVAIPGAAEQPATVASMPFIDPAKAIPKG